MGCWHKTIIASNSTGLLNVIHVVASVKWFNINAAVITNIVRRAYFLFQKRAKKPKRIQFHQGLDSQSDERTLYKSSKMSVSRESS